MKKNKKIFLYTLIFLFFYFLSFSFGENIPPQPQTNQNKTLTNSLLKKNPSLRWLKKRHPITIQPNRSINIAVSNVDVNRITCANNRQITDIIGSPKEKGYSKTIKGSELFLKLTKLKDTSTGKIIYMQNPIDIHIMCGNDVYPIILIPKKIRSRHIILDNKKDESKKTNDSLSHSFKALSLEEKLIKIIMQAKSDELPETYIKIKNKIKLNDIEKYFPNLLIIRNERITIGNENLILRKYKLSYSKEALKKKIKEIKLTEKMFFIPSIFTGLPQQEKMLAISLDSLTITPKNYTFLYIITYLKEDNTPFKSNFKTQEDKILF